MYDISLHAGTLQYPAFKPQGHPQCHPQPCHLNLNLNLNLTSYISPSLTNTTSCVTRKETPLSRCTRSTATSEGTHLAPSFPVQSLEPSWIYACSSLPPISRVLHSHSTYFESRNPKRDCLQRSSGWHVTLTFPARGASLVPGSTIINSSLPPHLSRTSTAKHGINTTSPTTSKPSGSASSSSHSQILLHAPTITHHRLELELELQARTPSSSRC